MPGSGVQVSSRSDTLSDSRPSATSNHTITFTVNTSIDTPAVNATDTLTLAFPSKFDLNSIYCKDVDLFIAGTATSVAGYFSNRSTSKSCPGSATSWGLLIDPVATTITFYTPTSVAIYAATGTQISIQVGTNASFQDTGTGWIMNPSSPGVYTISVGGTFGGSGNIPVSINSGQTVQATVAEALSLTVSSVGSQTPTLLQSGTCYMSGTDCTIDITNTAGNLLWVGINDYAMVGDGYVYSVSDISGNTYSVASPTTDTSEANAPQVITTFYAVNIPSGANTITCSRGSHAGSSGRCTVLEYSGISTASPLDAHQESANADTTSFTSGDITISNSNDLLIGFMVARESPIVWTAGSGWTIKTTNDTDFGVMTEDRVVNSTGVYSATATASVQSYGVGSINAFKAASNCAADDSAAVSQISTTAISVPFGSISPNTFYQGCQDLIVSTNAPAGYSLTVQEETMMQTANGQFVIPDTTCDAGDCTVVTATTWITPTKYGLGHTCTNQTGSDCNALFANGTKFKPIPNAAAGTGTGAIGFVQTQYDIVGSGKTQTFSLSSTSVNRDLLIVSVSYDNVAASVQSITDSKGNKYFLAIGPTTWYSNTYRTEIWYAKNITGGSPISITVTLTLNTTSFISTYAEEYSGIDTTDPLDQTSANAGDSAGPVDSGSKTTNYPDELIYGHGEGQGPAVTAGSGFTTRNTSNGNTDEDKFVTTTGSYNASFNLSQPGPYVAIMATFKAAPGVSQVLMSNSGPAASATGRAKYRLSVPPSQTAGEYKTVITYTILGTF